MVVKRIQCTRGNAEQRLAESTYPASACHHSWWLIFTYTWKWHTCLWTAKAKPKKKSHRNKLGSYRQACGRPLGTITKASLGAGWRGAEHPERVPVPHLFTFSPEESSFSSGLTPRLWLLRAPRCSMDGWSQGLPHDSAEPRRPGQGAWGLRKGFGDN